MPKCYLLRQIAIAALRKLATVRLLQVTPLHPVKRNVNLSQPLRKLPALKDRLPSSRVQNDVKDSTGAGTVSTRNRSSVTKKTNHDKYLKLHPQLEDDTIQKMSNENVLQELMKLIRKRKISISTETFAKAGGPY